MSSEIIIPPTKKQLKLSESVSIDRLSDLSDCIILHKLSLLNAENAVRTCILSPRWKDLWKRLPALIMHSSDFRTYKIFNKFVSKVLSLHDSSISVHTLDFSHNGRLESHLLKRIVNCAISHKVQRLGLSVHADIAQIPPSIFSSQTLTYLKLGIYSGVGHETMFPKSLNFPALTNLQLWHFAFSAEDNDCAEPFSTFNRLNSLVLHDCTVKGAQILRISNETIVSLTMDKNIYNLYNIDLSTPSLCKFVFTGSPYQKLSGSNASSLKYVDIYAHVVPFSEDTPYFLFCWLLGLANIKSLTVSTTTLQVISLIPDLLKINQPSLHNLESLKVKMEEISYKFRITLRDAKLQKAKSQREAARIRKAFKAGLGPSSPVPDGIVDFLLQNSPLAEVDFIDRSRRTL